MTKKNNRIFFYFLRNYAHEDPNYFLWTRHNVAEIVFYQLIDRDVVVHRYYDYVHLKCKDIKKIFNVNIDLKLDIYCIIGKYFMNTNGEVIPHLKHHFNLNIHDIFCIIHDDVDLSIGTIWLSFYTNSGGGHNGVKSFFSAINKFRINRFRIGIKPLSTKGIKLHKFVLERFLIDEYNLIISSIFKKKYIEYFNRFITHYVKK